jgi:hypothetical protein
MAICIEAGGFAWITYLVLSIQSGPMTEPITLRETPNAP